MDSPFADDFGSNHNGFHFQDGTSEQDVSLTDLLDDLENNVCRRYSHFGSMILSSGNNDWLNQGLAKSESFPLYGSDMNSDTFPEQVKHHLLLFRLSTVNLHLIP